MADGRVWVSPGMFETKVMVAPNSPIDLAKARIEPARMPGRINGSVTARKTKPGLAPSVSGGGLELRVDGLDRQADGAHHEGEAHHRTGQRRAGPAEGEDDAEMIGEERADRRLPAEAEQQQITGHHRGQISGRWMRVSSRILP